MEQWIHTFTRCQVSVTTSQRSQAESNEAPKLRHAHNDHRPHNQKGDIGIGKPSDASVPVSYVGPKLSLDFVQMAPTRQEFRLFCSCIEPRLSNPSHSECPLT